MPLTLKSFRLDARQAEATVAELEAAASKAAEDATRIAAERDEARKAAERAAKQAAEERRRAVEASETWVVAAERHLAAALAERDDTERPDPVLRGRARAFLWGDRRPDALPRIADGDLTVGALLDAQRHAGRVMRALVEEAGLEPEHELMGRIDTVECACWRGVVARVRWLAGEVE